MPWPLRNQRTGVGPQAFDFMLHGLLEAHRSPKRSEVQQPARRRRTQQLRTHPL